MAELVRFINDGEVMALAIRPRSSQITGTDALVNAAVAKLGKNPEVNNAAERLVQAVAAGVLSAEDYRPVCARAAIQFTEKWISTLFEGEEDSTSEKIQTFILAGERALCNASQSGFAFAVERSIVAFRTAICKFDVDELIKLSWDEMKSAVPERVAYLDQLMPGSSSIYVPFLCNTLSMKGYGEEKIHQILESVLE